MTIAITDPFCGAGGSILAAEPAGARARTDRVDALDRASEAAGEPQ